MLFLYIVCMSHGLFKMFGYYLFKKRGPTCGQPAVGTKIPWRPKAATHAGDRRPEVAWGLKFRLRTSRN